ncbi:TetR/AcrR family transcriptional regulator [Streptacidiphilus monticola]
MPAAPEKRAAITRAALTVFGRDGYSRAGMDALAKEAGVSTRTVYNHFPGGKEQLFATVIHDSADAVRAATFDLMARHLDGLLDRAAADVPDALHALALDWVSPWRSSAPTSPWSARSSPTPPTSRPRSSPTGRPPARPRSGPNSPAVSPN